MVAALNWQPLTLLLDTLLHWPNISMALSQVALVALRGRQLRDDHDGLVARVSPPSFAASRCGSTASQSSSPSRAMVAFFAAGQQPEMSPEEYLRTQPRLRRHRTVMAAATAVRAAGAHAGVMGRHAALEPNPARPGAVRVHRRHRADRAAPARSSSCAPSAPRSSSVSVRPPLCSAARCWWWPQARCCPAWRTGSARAANCGPSSRCSTNSATGIPTSASGCVREDRWCSGWPSGCR